MTHDHKNMLHAAITLAVLVLMFLAACWVVKPQHEPRQIGASAGRIGR